VDYQGI